MATQTETDGSQLGKNKPDSKVYYVSVKSSEAPDEKGVCTCKPVCKKRQRQSQQAQIRQSSVGSKTNDEGEATLEQPVQSVKSMQQEPQENVQSFSRQSGPQENINPSEKTPSGSVKHSQSKSLTQPGENEEADGERKRSSSVKITVTDTDIHENDSERGSLEKNEFNGSKTVSADMEDATNGSPTGVNQGGENPPNEPDQAEGESVGGATKQGSLRKGSVNPFDFDEDEIEEYRKTDEVTPDEYWEESIFHGVQNKDDVILEGPKTDEELEEEEAERSKLGKKK